MTRTITFTSHMTQTNVFQIFSARGCLFNIARDPTESHDLWLRANNIAALLTSRLRALWSQQRRRGPSNIQSQADPANFNYVWTPWVNQNSGPNITAEINTKQIANNPNNSTIAIVVNCNGTVGIRNFLCVLKSIL